MPFLPSIAIGSGKREVNEFRGEEPVATIAINFRKVVVNKYINSFSKNDGKPGNVGKTIMGAVLNGCHHRRNPVNQA